MTEQTAAAPLTFDEALAQTVQEIRKRLRGASALIRPLTAHLSRAAGKHIRASAVLTCAMAPDGGIPGGAVRLAAAVELLHLATLVHDDIIDGADLRRGIRSLHSKFGVKEAVLCGDYLFCLALELAAGAGGEDRRALSGVSLPNYMSDILLGEIRQDRNSGNLSLTERQYFKIIGGKTAAMFEASYLGGYILSDEPEDVRESFMTIGRNTGLVFQLSDDCADYEATRKRSKKPVLSDLKTGVVTLPLIAALRNDGSLSGRLRALDSPAALKKAVADAGGLLYTHRKITEYYEKTAAMIAALPSAPEKKARLSALLRRAAGLPAEAL